MGGHTCENEGVISSGRWNTAVSRLKLVDVWVVMSDDSRGRKVAAVPFTAFTHQSVSFRSCLVWRVWLWSAHVGHVGHRVQVEDEERMDTVEIARV